MLLSSHSVVSDSVTPWTTAHQTSLSFTISRSLLKLMSIESWCHPTISSSVVPFSSCLQSFPASGSFPMSQLFVSGGLSIRLMGLGGGINKEMPLLSHYVREYPKSTEHHSQEISLDIYTGLKILECSHVFLTWFPPFLTSCIPTEHLLK